MFDWNDEEFANIIWGEEGETDDHIVPYPEGNEDRPPGLYGGHIKKEWNQEATNAKPPVQNKYLNNNDYAGDKQEGALRCDSAEGTSAGRCRMEPWPDLSLSHASKTRQDSMGTEVSKDLTEITEIDSSRCDATSQLDGSSSIFQNQHDDGEQSDFVDYGWDNIGSFDDLDRIFSDDDQIFGHVSLGKDDRPWSSFKESTCTAEKSFPLCMDSTSLDLGTAGSTSGHFKIKTEYVQDQDQSFTQGFGKMSFLSSHAQNNVHARAHQVDFMGGTSKFVAKEKVSNKEKLSETRKKTGGGHEGQHCQDSSTRSPSGNKLQQIEMPQICIGYALGDQTQLQSFNSSVAPPGRGNIRNPYPTRTSLPHSHNREEEKPVFSGCEVSTSTTNPLSRFSGTFTKPLTMTPQEKIEKLRRRQQMHALLAIQRQQQQFSNKVSSSDHSVSLKCHDDQIQLMPGGNIEVEETVSTLLSIDPNSPAVHDGLNSIPMVVDDCHSVEAITLHQLQEIVAKLDIRMRIFMRDSLFRLAQSAMHRHYAGDTSSINKNSGDELEFCTDETSSHMSFTRIPDVETETNRIDRAVAHLLFHRPELSGKHSQTPESPSLTKLPCEINSGGLLCSPREFLSDNSRREQKPHFIVENAANEALDAGVKEIGAPNQ
ncbi:hypothetical protein RHMOL_Rhmol07G0078100 [Rhododendron molle]|uniref:Uncharacterized protein n=1 Tax=Rhododendron molle TaxID=49168 RepID=A0ACC0MYY0_RHOML|nr:hypothetical protein RHMOL_Rhmol07G0078100 [Rhododendron molle]